MRGLRFPYSDRTNCYLWFTAPPFIIFNVLEQVSHDAVLAMPETERLDASGLQIAADGAPVARPAIRDGFEGHIFSTRRDTF
jgi:hypothetical protein